MTDGAGGALLALLPIVVILVPDDVPGATGETAEADARALSNYRLNRQDLDRWAEVMRSPEQRAAVADESGDGRDVSDLRELIEGNPEYRAAVERAGLTPTRFAIITSGPPGDVTRGTRGSNGFVPPAGPPPAVSNRSSTRC